MAIAKTPYRQRSHGTVAYSWLMTITKESRVSFEQGKEAIQDVDTTSRSFESKIYRRSCLEPLPPPQPDTASIIMIREFCTHQANEPPLTYKKSKDLDNPVFKLDGSDKATHGSLSSASASSGQDSIVILSRRGSWDGNSDASYETNKREAWALQKWLEQAPRDEPWSPGSQLMS